MSAHLPEGRNKFLPTLAVLYTPEQIAHVWEAFPARRTPTAGFPGEKLGEIQSGFNQADFMIKNHDCTGTQSMSGFFHGFKIHLNIIKFSG
jgi:hypothetical protein